jgi:hypothetical protein
MKNFLQKTFGTTSVRDIELAELKKVLEGEPLMKRTMYRKMNAVAQSRPAIKKGEKYRKEHVMAANYDKSQRNLQWGFKCLHLSVSEANHVASITIENKQGIKGEITVKTRDDTATAPDDYEAIDTLLQFKSGEKSKTIEINIVNDNGYEPDEDFYVELYHEGTKLANVDCVCKVTILDDDKPGTLCFKNPKVKHPANVADCVI